MTINSNVGGDLSILINDYHQQTTDSLDHLSSQLKNTSKRIQFEKWLINEFSSESAIKTDFSWKNKVLKMLVANLVLAKPSAESQQHEDHLLADLISKAFPLPKDGEGLQSKANSVHQVGLPIFNTKLISEEMKEANLPSISTALMGRVLDDDFLEILDKAILNNNIALLKAVIKQNPIGFKEALLRKDSEGNTPVALSVKMNRSEILKMMIAAAHDEVNSALTIQNNEGHTPVALAVGYYLPDLLMLMHKNAPEGFLNSLTMKAKDGFTPVAIAVCTNSLDIIKFMAEVASQQLNDAMAMQDIDGNTPIIASVLNLEMFKLIANVASEGFRKGLVLQNLKGDTAVSLSSRDVIMLKFIKERAPQEFKQAIVLRDAEGLSVLDKIKRSRIKNYSQIIKLFEKNSHVRRLNKEIVNRKAMGHAWNISGVTALTATGTNDRLENIRLEGWLAPQWFHIIGKDLDKFESLYPEEINDADMNILKESLDLGANPHTYSLEEKLQRIKDGKATIFSTGYSGHEVTLLIWGDKFVICNRGGATRKPIEYFHFDQLKLDLSDLRKIASLEKGNEEQYKDLFFKILPTKLAFTKTGVDIMLEENGEMLPYQTVGNCSFVSPITSVYAMRMLKDTYGVDEKGCLLSKQHNKNRHKTILSKETSNILSKGIEKTNSWYQKWLSFEQITLLERSLLPLEKGMPYFEPDHALIQRCLHKAHLLQLDDISNSKLSALTTIYLNSLEPEEQAELKIDLAFWGMIKSMRGS